MPRYAFAEPESDVVLRTIQTALAQWNGETLASGHIEEGRLITGYQSFSYEDIILKKPKNWRWNLTTHHRDLSLAPSLMVELKKMVPRGRTKGFDVPKYRIWICTIRREQKPLHFIWCERGLDVRDFSFLREFVSAQVAKELNWDD